MKYDIVITIFSFVALVAIIFFLLIYFSKKINNKIYNIDFFGLIIATSSKDVLQLCAFIFLYAGLSSLFPPVFAVFIVILWFLTMGKIKQVDALRADQKSEQLLKILSSNQKLIGEVKDHIEFLSRDVQTKQKEIQEKQFIKEKLDREIQEKSKEANAWQSLTDEQKNLVLDATRAVVSKENKGTFWSGLFFGFVFNILATLTWTLLGNPGKEQIIEKAVSFASLFLQ